MILCPTDSFDTYFLTALPNHSPSNTHTKNFSNSLSRHTHVNCYRHTVGWSFKPLTSFFSVIRDLWDFRWPQFYLLSKQQNQKSETPAICNLMFTLKANISDTSSLGTSGQYRTLPDRTVVCFSSQPYFLLTDMQTADLSSCLRRTSCKTLGMS